MAGYRLAANGHVVKPVQLEAFIEAVRQLRLYWVPARHAPAGGAG